MSNVTPHQKSKEGPEITSEDSSFSGGPDFEECPDDIQVKKQPKKRNSGPKGTKKPNPTRKRPRIHSDTESEHLEENVRPSKKRSRNPRNAASATIGVKPKQNTGSTTTVSSEPRMNAEKESPADTAQADSKDDFCNGKLAV